MPTISAHVSETTAAKIETAAKVSPEKKVGPWLAEAANQRLEREGMNSEENLARAEIIALADSVGPKEALAKLRQIYRDSEKPAA